MTGEPSFFVTHPISEPGMGWLRHACRVHTPAQPPSPEELRSACASGDFDVVVAQLSDRFDPDLLGTAKMAGISNHSVDYHNIVPAATTKGISVGDTPDALADATALVDTLRNGHLAAAIAHGQVPPHCVNPEAARNG